MRQTKDIRHIVFRHNVMIKWAENIIFVFGILLIISMTITDIYEAMNGKAESFFEWAQAHPKYGLLFAAGLFVVWLAGLLFRWKWACHWQFNSSLWFFDDCKPETRRKVQMVLVGMAIIACLTMIFCMEITVWERTIGNTGSASSTICGMSPKNGASENIAISMGECCFSYLAVCHNHTAWNTVDVSLFQLDCRPCHRNVVLPSALHILQAPLHSRTSESDQ